MQIFSISAAHHGCHDGATACIADGRLIFSIEAEKDSGARYAELPEELVLRSLAKLPRLPDVWAQSGWSEDYNGLGEVASAQFEFFKNMRYWRSTHERAHIFCTYGLSPFAQGEPCYVLVWEGTIGCFYKVDRRLNIEHLGTPLAHPGHRYQLLWALANAGIGDWYEQTGRDTPQKALPAFQQIILTIPATPDGPGKLMALSAFANPNGDENRAVEDLVRFLTSMQIDDALLHEPQARLETVLQLLSRWEPFHRARVLDQVFKNIAGRLTEVTYDIFYKFARANLRERLPLLIAGGCGLNCTWNTNWKECGLFPDTFIPPCTNDSGIAIGAGIDAQQRFTGHAKVDWSVMAGEEFVLDADLSAQADFVREELDYSKVAHLLARNAVVCWVQGKYEMGPRALGHRSILAAPFEAAMLARLNRLKKRESYRPIAPICLEEDIGEYFDWSGPSPYMLHFQKLKTDRLKAVTHVDNTARAQTVSKRQDDRTHRLLSEFKRQTGFGVLCNTSLNFKGKGFINRSSDLLRFASQEDVDALVINSEVLIKRAALEKYL